jgi:hypothetical protein
MISKFSTFPCRQDFQSDTQVMAEINLPYRTVVTILGNITKQMNLSQAGGNGLTVR